MLFNRTVAPRVITSLVLAGFLLGSAPARAGKLGALKPSARPIALLSGRLNVQMPPGARLEARRASIMAAPEAADKESRVVLDAGSERLVLMVLELFALAGPAFEATVKKEVAGTWSSKEVTYSVEKLAAGKGLQVMALTPSRLVMRGDAGLALAAYVASPDGTVQMLRFFVNPEGAKDEKGCLALVKKLASTVAAGNRKLQTAAGPRKLGNTLEVKLPAGWITSLQQGPDFEVYHLRKLVPLGQPGPSMGVYLGGHPALQHKQAGKAGAATQRQGLLLGAKATWHSWAMRAGARSRTMVEAIVPARGQQAHVFYSSETPADQKELEAVAASLKLLKK